MIRARIGKKIPPGFSLDVEFEAGGGVTALYGPRGAGKTLILEILAGFVRPDSGRILCENVLLFDADAGVHVRTRRRGCTYLPRRDSLFPHLTLRQNLAFAARGARLERHRRIAEMLDRFALSADAPRRPADLDPALRLRAALARALLAAPKLLLVDHPDFSEPLCRQLRREFTGPVLVATRDLDLCAAVAGQMLVLEAGRVLRQGTPAEVLDQPESAAVARLLGIPNLFECTIAGLDPGRNSSRLRIEIASESFELVGPYVPGHFRGDRVLVAIRPERVRVHSADSAEVANACPRQLSRASERVHGVRLEFSGGIVADLSREEYDRQKDNRGWQVELPPEALRIL